MRAKQVATAALWVTLFVFGGLLLVGIVETELTSIGILLLHFGLACLFSLDVAIDRRKNE